MTPPALPQISGQVENTTAEDRGAPHTGRRTGQPHTERSSLRPLWRGEAAEDGASYRPQRAADVSENWQRRGDERGAEDERWRFFAAAAGCRRLRRSWRSGGGGGFGEGGGGGSTSGDNLSVPHSTAKQRRSTPGALKLAAAARHSESQEPEARDGPGTEQNTPDATTAMTAPGWWKPQQKPVTTRTDQGAQLTLLKIRSEQPQ